jgi:hypothetical protein
MPRKPSLAREPLPSRYREWITHVFDRPVTGKGWYFDRDDVEFAANDSEVVALIAATMRRCGEDLTRFSDHQVSHRLNFIFHDSCSNSVWSLMADSAPKDVRTADLDQMRNFEFRSLDSVIQQQRSDLWGHEDQRSGAKHTSPRPDELTGERQVTSLPGGTGNRDFG